MTENALEKLRYPVGRFAADDEVTPAKRTAWIDGIAAAPGNFRAAVKGLGERELDTPYRPGGWTVRQVVHHVADSHVNSYIRFRFALTEEQPTIKPYFEALWAELYDAKSLPVEVSLNLLDALHERWVVLLRSMTPDQFARTLYHPEWGTISLDFLLQVYAWHCRHHLAHITNNRA